MERQIEDSIKQEGQDSRQEQTREGSRKATQKEIRKRNQMTFGQEQHGQKQSESPTQSHGKKRGGKRRDRRKLLAFTKAKFTANTELISYLEESLLPPIEKRYDEWAQGLNWPQPGQKIVEEEHFKRDIIDGEEQQDGNREGSQPGVRAEEHGDAIPTGFMSDQDVQIMPMRPADKKAMPDAQEQHEAAQIEAATLSRFRLNNMQLLNTILVEGKSDISEEDITYFCKHGRFDARKEGIDQVRLELLLRVKTPFGEEKQWTTHPHAERCSTFQDLIRIVAGDFHNDYLRCFGRGMNFGDNGTDRLMALEVRETVSKGRPSSILKCGDDFETWIAREMTYGRRTVLGVVVNIETSCVL